MSIRIGSPKAALHSSKTCSRKRHFVTHSGTRTGSQSRLTLLMCNFCRYLKHLNIVKITNDSSGSWMRLRNPKRILGHFLIFLKVESPKDDKTVEMNSSAIECNPYKGRVILISL